MGLGVLWVDQKVAFALGAGLVPTFGPLGETIVFECDRRSHHVFIHFYPNALSPQ